MVKIYLLECLFFAMGISNMIATANDSIPINDILPRPAIMDSILTVDTITGISFITIHQDERIENLISEKIAGITERPSVQIHGYRLQVFSSNAQKTAKTAAFNTEKRIREKFPEIDIYVQYQPPFWKVRLGNFRTIEETAILREELLKQFPDIQGDIYPVKDFIQVSHK